MLGVIFLAAFVHIVAAKVTYINNDGYINLRKTLPPTVIRLHLRRSEENEVSLEDHDKNELSGNHEEKKETSLNAGGLDERELKDLSKEKSTNKDGQDESELQEKQPNEGGQEKLEDKQKSEEIQEISRSIEKQINEEVPETDSKNPGGLEEHELKVDKKQEEKQLSKEKSTNKDGQDKSESQEKQANEESQENSEENQNTEEVQETDPKNTGGLEEQELKGNKKKEETLLTKAKSTNRDGPDKSESQENQRNEEVPETDASKEQLKKKSLENKQAGDSYYIEKSNYAQESVGLIWPLGIIPYFVDYNSYDYLLAKRIRESMDIIESASCVRFKPVLVEPKGKYSWLHFTNPNKVRTCSHVTSSISRNDSKEETEIPVVIGLDCLKRREVLHAVLHAIGLKDEVTHPQRDLYIRVIWENIHPEYRDLFLKDNQERDTQNLVEYDPTSIMHFHDRAFSRNGQATIAPMMPGLRINPSETLSHLDKLKLRLIFSHECNRRKVDDLMDTCKMALHGPALKKLAALEHYDIVHKDDQDDHDEGDNKTSGGNRKEKTANDKSAGKGKEKTGNDKSVSKGKEKTGNDKSAGDGKEKSGNVKSWDYKNEKRGTQKTPQLSNEDWDAKDSEPKMSKAKLSRT